MSEISRAPLGQAVQQAAQDTQVYSVIFTSSREERWFQVFQIRGEPKEDKAIARDMRSAAEVLSET